VGDSLVKDVRMAQDTGVFDVWARYGVPGSCRAGVRSASAVDTLDERRRGTRKQLADRDTRPTRVLEHSLGELLDMFDFRTFEPAR
jgi:hypothetical protein